MRGNDRKDKTMTLTITRVLFRSTVAGLALTSLVAAAPAALAYDKYKSVVYCDSTEEGGKSVMYCGAKDMEGVKSFIAHLPGPDKEFVFDGCPDYTGKTSKVGTSPDPWPDRFTVTDCEGNKVAVPRIGN